MPEQPGSSADAVAVPVSLRFNCQHCRKRITAVANKEPIWITDVQCGICGMHHSIQWLNGQWDIRPARLGFDPDQAVPDTQGQSVSTPRPYNQYTFRTPCELCGTTLEVHTPDAVGRKVGVECKGCGAFYTIAWDFYASYIPSALGSHAAPPDQPPKRAIYLIPEPVDRTSPDAIG